MDIWKQTEAKARLILATLLSDFTDCQTTEDYTKFTDHVIKTFADNNLTVINADMLEEMADLCGPAMDELQDEYLDNDDEN